MKYGLSYTLITRCTGWLSRTILHFRKTELDYISNSLINKDNVRILDYGCNTGYFLDFIKKHNQNKHFDLCGADINGHALKYAKQKYNQYKFFEINEKFFNTEKFDIIILSHVLEHISDTQSFLQNLKKILKKDGELIIAVPQERIRGDCTIIQLLYNIIRLRFENPHLINYKYTDIEKILNQNGFTIKHSRFTHFFYPFESNRRRLDSWSLVVFCKLI